MLVRLALALKVPNPEFLLADDFRETITADVEGRRIEMGLPPTRGPVQKRADPEDEEKPVLVVTMLGRSAGIAVASRILAPEVRAVRLRELPDATARLAKVRDAVQVAAAERRPRLVVLPDDHGHDELARTLGRALAIRRVNLGAARRHAAGGPTRNPIVSAETALAHRFPWLWPRLRPTQPGNVPKLLLRDGRLRYWRPALAALALALFVADPLTPSRYDGPNSHHHVAS